MRCDDITRDAPVLAKEGDGHLSYWFGAYGLNNEGAGPGNFGMLLDPDGNQPWTMYDRDQGALPEGQWVHLASVREGTTVRHYLNGQSLGDTGGSFTGAIHISDAFLAIGVNSLYNFSSRHTAFLGAIDEVRLYNYALTPAEVAALYASTTAPTLHIEHKTNTVVVSWPLPAEGWVLEATNALPAGRRRPGRRFRRRIKPTARISSSRTGAHRQPVLPPAQAVKTGKEHTVTMNPKSEARGARTCLSVLQSSGSCRACDSCSLPALSP